MGQYAVTQIDVQSGKGEVIGFWQKNFPSWPFEKYDWLYRQNVFGPARCWTLVRDGKTVGSAAAFPRDFMFRGRKLHAAVTGDLGVDTDNRLLGPAVQLQRTLVKEHPYDFLYAFPNRNSEPVQTRVGFRIVGPAVRMVLMLRADRIMRQRLKFPLAAKLSAALANRILQMRHGGRKPNKGGFRIEEPESFDSRFDRLWETVATNTPRLMGVRDRKFLIHRFTCCPYVKYRIFALIQATDGSLAGYVVYRVQDKRVLIADCLTPEVDERFDLLLSTFASHAHAAGYEAVSMIFLGDEAVLRRLQRVGFSRRADQRNVTVAVNPSVELPEETLDQNYWYFCEADND